MNNELEKTLEKYFGTEKTLYYSTYDGISNNQFIRWSYYYHCRNRILISIGSDDGEVNVKVFTDSEELAQFIKIIIS